jgi:hypothetical protein
MTSNLPFFHIPHELITFFNPLFLHKLRENDLEVIFLATLFTKNSKYEGK